MPSVVSTSTHWSEELVVDLAANHKERSHHQVRGFAVLNLCRQDILFAGYAAIRGMHDHMVRLNRAPAEDSPLDLAARPRRCRTTIDRPGTVPVELFPVHPATGRVGRIHLPVTCGSVELIGPPVDDSVGGGGAAQAEGIRWDAEDFPDNTTILERAEHDVFVEEPPAVWFFASNCQDRCQNGSFFAPVLTHHSFIHSSLTIV